MGANKEVAGRQTSRNRIYRVIYENRGVSRQTIADTLRMSLPTVVTYLNELMEEGLVTETGVFASTGGRRAVSYEISEDSRMAVGMEVTADYAKAVLMNLRGRVLAREKVEVPFSYTKEYARILSDLLGRVKKKAKKKTFLGVGIALPAILSADGTRMLHAETLGVEDVETDLLRSEMEDRVLFFHDSAAAGLAEGYACPPAAHLAYLYLSDTVGGAILNHRELVFGRHGQSAEFGHMILHPGGKRCYCGRRGCADTCLSAKHMTKGMAGGLSGFFERLERREDAAVEVFASYRRDLALLISNIRVTLDCDLILGGDVGGFLEPYMGEIKEEIQRIDGGIMPVDYLRPCAYPEDAAAKGGAFLMIQEFVRQSFREEGLGEGCGSSIDKGQKNGMIEIY